MLDPADPHPVTDTLTQENHPDTRSLGGMTELNASNSEQEDVENPGLGTASLNSALTEAMGLNIEEVEQGNWL